ncbi:TPA: hypothetical protein DCX16_03490, partial [bacterium]|nr:hypothetical protein [bacterium]
ESTPRPITLTSQEVLRLTTETLKKHLNLLVKGHKYTDETIFHILTKASVKKSTIEETSIQLKKALHFNGVRYQLKSLPYVDIQIFLAYQISFLEVHHEIIPTFVIC